MRRELSEAEFAEAWLALELGLLPDPWQHTGTIAAAALSASGAKVQPRDFYPRLDRRRSSGDDGRPRLTAAAAEAILRRRFGGR